MNPLTLSLRSEIRTRVDLTGITPDRLQDLTLTEIRKLRLHCGSRTRSVDQLFTVKGQPKSAEVVLTGSRGLLDQVVSRLLGLQLKLAQYRRGKEFADVVVAEGGIRALNRVWKGPGQLPSAAELEDPERWMARVGARRRRFALR